jgi:octaprenyl-diphosphate synthase
MLASAISMPPWARAELEQVHDVVKQALPETLRPFWDADGFGLSGLLGREPLRPFLVLLLARHYGCTGGRPLRLAASIHMIHMASLLHDRLGRARRAQENADPEYHRREALDILLGDFFFSKASDFIVEDGEPRIIREHIRTSIESAEAQARLVSLSGELDRVEAAECFEVVADKVSLLLALSLRVGGLLGNASAQEEEGLAGCGFLLGRAVRILEDLSLWERASREGLHFPPDARFCHPLILLWEKEGKGAWERADRQLSSASGGEDIAGLRALLDAQGCLAGSRRTASGFLEQALRRLDRFPDTEELGWFRSFARSLSSPGQEGTS